MNRRVGHIITALFLLLVIVPWGTARAQQPSSNVAPSNTRRFTGFVRSVGWVTFAGSRDAGIYEDSVARWRAQPLLGYSPNLLALVYPSSLNPPFPTPSGAEAITHRVAAHELRQLFLPNGRIIRQFQQSGSRPDLVVFQLSAHSGSDGSTSWGAESFSLSDLESMLVTLHTTFQGQVPVILFADKCHAGSVRLILEHLQIPAAYRNQTYIILSSSSEQGAYTQTFRDAWQHRARLWPAITYRPDIEDRIHEIFDDSMLYGRQTIHLLLSIFTAPDAGQDGLDAQDVCNDLRRTEALRYQPPISAPESERSDIVCESPSHGNTSQPNWAAHFAFSIPTISIGLDQTTRPEFMGNNAFTSLLDAAQSVFEEHARTMGIPSGSLVVGRCESPCHQDWVCRADWGQQTGYGMTCRQHPREIGVGISEAPTLDEFRNRFGLRAQRIIVPSWAPQVSGRTSPRIEATAPVTYAVLLDRSASMGNSDTPGNDTDGRKRRLFFDAVIAPALWAGRVQRFLVASFSEDVRVLSCFDRTNQPNVDQARRCFLQEITANGGTNLTRAARLLAAQLSEHDVVFVVSDGAHSMLDPECGAFVDSTRSSCGSGEAPLHYETHTPTICTTPQFYQCRSEQLRRSGQQLAQGRTVIAVFLAGIAGDPAALHELAQIRNLATDGGRFVILDNVENPSDQVRRLSEVGLTNIGRGIDTISATTPTCDDEGEALLCRVNAERIDVRDGTQVVIRWERRVVSQQVIVVRPMSTRNESTNTAGTVATLSQRRPSETFENGVRLLATFGDDATRLVWSVPTGQPTPTGRWSIEFQYLQIGEER